MINIIKRNPTVKIAIQLAILGYHFLYWNFATATIIAVA